MFWSSLIVHPERTHADQGLHENSEMPVRLEDSMHSSKDP